MTRVRRRRRAEALAPLPRRAKPLPCFGEGCNRFKVDVSLSLYKSLFYTPFISTALAFGS
jgi:hypothetical protein